MKTRAVRWYRKEYEMYSEGNQEDPEALSSRHAVSYYPTITGMWFTYSFTDPTLDIMLFRGMSQREKFEKQYLKWKDKNEG